MTGSTYRSANAAAPDRDAGLTLLLRGIADRDRRAFAALHAVLAPGLRNQIVAGGLSERDADAVLATTFIEVWQLARLPIDRDADVLAWIQKAIERRCSERRHRMRESALGSGAAEADSIWQRIAAAKDESAKVELDDLLRGDPAVADPVPGRQNAIDRWPTAPQTADEQPGGYFTPRASKADDPPAACRPRRADLGAAAVFGHRRGGGRTDWTDPQPE